jgi:UDP-2,3-diacylglucosamine pyrophosphatase LpxH
MNEAKITVVIKTDKEFDVCDIFTIMQDFKARLEGYHTETPEQLKNAELNVDKKYFINGNEKDVFIEIKKLKEIERRKNQN